MTNEIDQQIQEQKFFIRGVIDRFEGKKAVIATEDNQKIIWPIENLPENVGEGSSIRLVISTSATNGAEREKIAKTILNEILKTNNHP